jgi:transcription initiation factor TFIIE subunit alpha
VSEKDQVLATLARKIHGEVAGRIIERLIKVGEATDEQLSQALGIEIGTIRRVLNELYESRLVKYRRVRDEEQGWYLYYWRLTDEYPTRVLEERRRKAVEVLKRRLEFEKSNSFFYCLSCGTRFSFDEVADNMFRCPYCGTDLEALDGSLVTEKLEKAIKLLESIKFE